MLELDWKPSKESRTPVYRQIIQYIKAKIARGEWAVGATLPSQREMAHYFQVNRSTLSIAIDELIADGLLDSKVGSGTRVSNNSWSLKQLSVPLNWNHYIEAGWQQPNFSIIQEVNKYALFPGITNFYKGELSADLYPCELMQKLIKNVPLPTNTFGYAEPRGLLVLREQLSLYLKTIGINASPASILIVSGALQGLQLIALGLIQLGEEILLESPSYLYSLNLFHSMGIKQHGIPCDVDGIKVSSLQQNHLQAHGSLLFTIPCFHNPTGRLMSKQRREDLVTYCEKAQLPIIEDDVYRELWLDSPPPPAIKSFDNTGLVVYIGSLSKSLYPGLRIGWVVGPEDVINRLADIKMQIDYGSSSFSQWIATAWFDSGYYQMHLANVRSELRLRRELFLEVLEAHFQDIATWEIPLGGFYIWLTLKQPVSMTRLFKNALKKGIIIAPGNLYGPLYDRQIRLCYCYSPLVTVKNDLPRLAAIIRELMLNRG
jgi:Transcriptional regulators containing a DNA-binding HTH domain and an aminotransferase domain (MocR family) and their eukaryotic orthologs